MKISTCFVRITDSFKTLHKQEHSRILRKYYKINKTRSDPAVRLLHFINMCSKIGYVLIQGKGKVKVKLSRA